MKIMKALVGSCLLAVMPLAAQAADGMSYSYVDLGYNEIDIDGAPSGDGLGLRGSIGFAENFFAFAEYANFGFPASVDVDVYSVGLGGRLGVSDRVDLVGRVGYTEADFSAGGFSADADGYLVSAGVRAEVAEGFELEGSVIYSDYGSSGGDDTELAVGGRYFFTENFAAGAEFRTGDDADTIFVGVRFAF
ncbi:MAG TPA: outer membrane beta-barrel protein [Steroidobacteraceae bacterium]|nr:outer membrane beta-barrel protein [Steroidobacteraceae bacterium]